MALNKFVVLLISAVVILQMRIQSDALRITINPDKCIGTIQDKVEISCAWDGGRGISNDVTVIEISRNNENPMVFLRQCNNITYRHDLSSQLKATGFINKETGQSSLNITLLTPRTEDTGVYTCLVYYMDDAGNVFQETSSANFVVEKLDLLSLEESLHILKKRMSDLETNSKGDLEKNNNLTEAILNLEGNYKKEILDLEEKYVDTHSFESIVKNLIEKMSYLEQKRDEKDNNLTEAILNLEGDHKKQILDLEEKYNNLTETTLNLEGHYKKQIFDLEEKLTYTSAFSAINDVSHFSLLNGRTVVFPILTLNHGSGYNVSSGVFTAPKAGLYAINLVVRKYNANQYLKFAVKTKAGTVGKLSLIDNKNEIQSSISVLVDLQVGDDVWAVLYYANNFLNIYGAHESIFSGYLIRPF